MCELHQALSDGTAYPDPTERIEYIETHISRLYLTRDLVYKLKKKVSFGFCDFTRLTDRRFYCQEEVRLNRRLAPDTYLGVSQIVRQGGQILIDQPGEICEYAVRMRRLPQKRMLTTLLDAPLPCETLPQALQKIGHLLAEFHRTAQRIDRAIHDDPRTLRANWRQNFAQTRDCPAELIRPVTHASLETLILSRVDAEAELFRQRQQAGFVRDGHGDLHCEHICLSEPIQIFDCIDFNPQLRYGDILSDLAFLYMDLELHGRPDLARLLWQSYGQQIDTGPQAERLLLFYCLYRAWVRAKIHHLQSLIGPTPCGHQQRSKSYFRLACRYALPPMLLLCCGRIGSGKTTLARDLAAALNAELLSSDLMRPLVENAEDSVRSQSRYSIEQRMAVYRRMAQHIVSDRSRRQPLIIDATFENQQMRDLFLGLAERTQLPCWFIEARCPDQLIRRRLEKRGQSPSSSGGSEAGVEEFERQRLRFEPWIPLQPLISVDTGQPRENNVDFVIEKLVKTCGTTL